MTNNIPNHVAIIMDGNGRWATKKNLPRTMGHLEGANTLEKLTKHIFNKGINVLSVFAFSTENFKREKEEVDFMMDLFLKRFNTLYKLCQKNSIRVLFSKKELGLPIAVEEQIKKIEFDTKNNNKGILNICMNYGAQDEIMDMATKIAIKVQAGEIDPKDIDKDLINANLYQKLPPIDLLIRTSGELRISNFMLWQLAYAELYFPDTYFPDFKEKEFDKALEEFNKRERRFGKIIAKSE